jgi:calcium-dependent protein kinase
LKPENVLVNDGIYKVADYGFGKRVPNYETDILTDACGTPLYMSP